MKIYHFQLKEPSHPICQRPSGSSRTRFAVRRQRAAALECAQDDADRSECVGDVSCSVTVSGGKILRSDLRGSTRHNVRKSINHMCDLLAMIEQAIDAFDIHKGEDTEGTKT